MPRALAFLCRMQSAARREQGLPDRYFGEVTVSVTAWPRMRWAYVVVHDDEGLAGGLGSLRDKDQQRSCTLTEAQLGVDTAAAVKDRFRCSRGEEAEAEAEAD